MNARGAVLLVAVSILASGACSSETDEEQKRLAELSQGCLINSDCKNPLACVFRKCHEQCADTRDCPDGLLCVVTDDEGLRVCQLPTETKCLESSDCPGKQICAPDGRCRDFCETVDDCGPEQVCANQGACAETEEVDPNGDLPVADAGVGGAGGAGGSAGAAGSSGSGGSGGNGGAGGAAGAAGSGGSAGGGGATDAGSDASADASLDSGSDGGGCPAGFADCDSNPADCETALDQVTSCGSCTNACAAPNAQVACGPSLTCAIGACTVGFGDCDGSFANGCEADFSTNAQHCGKCGRTCGAGTCQSGQCTAATLGTFTGSTPKAAITADHVYVLTEASGTYTLTRYAKDGSGTQPVDTVSSNAGGIAADASFVYVGRTIDGIERYAAATGQPDPTWSATVSPLPEHLAVRGTAFYWLTQPGASYTAPKSTASPALALAPSPGSGNADGIAVSATAVYFDINNAWYAVPLGGGPATPIGGLPSVQVQRIAAAGTTAYAAMASNGIYAHVFDPQKTQQDPAALLLSAVVSFNGLTSDGTSVIYTRASDPLVYSVPAAGGNAVPLGSIGTSVAGVFGHDAQFVYVHSSTTVYQLAK